MTSIEKTIATLRDNGGFCKLPEYGLLEVYGKDATRFLQAQTTNDVAALSECQHQETCILDRKARLRACFDLYRRHQSFRILAPKGTLSAICDHFDSFKIADKVEFIDVSSTGMFLTVQGPRSRQLLYSGLRSRTPNQFNQALSDPKLWNVQVHMFAKSITGEDGYFLWLRQSELDSFWDTFREACLKAGFVELTADALNIARIEAGQLRFGVDYAESDFLPETGLDAYTVSYTKGCFLGQEVLARVKAQGAPTRGMVGLNFGDQEFPLALGSKFMIGEVDAATIKSATYSPTLHANIALASARREYRVPGERLRGLIGEVVCEATVQMLPLYKAASPTERAHNLYQEALSLYPSESDDVVESNSVLLLREALDLDPLCENAYEALGVILSKRDRLDEAIALMAELARMNPDCAIAHTNLSVFYMQKGDKERAEEEKAEAMNIRMRLAAKQFNAEKEATAAKEQEKEAARQRMEMFSQVLEIDSEDLLANYGLGDCFIALEEYDKALAPLQKAIAIKPTHTVAYLALGKALEGTGKPREAIEIYEKGVQVASARGDLSPLKIMQERVSVLRATVEKSRAV